MPEPVKYLLPESEIPTIWTNLMADLGPPEHPPLHPGTQQPLKPIGVVASDFRDGKIGCARFFPTWQEALDAAGV